MEGGIGFSFHQVTNVEITSAQPFFCLSHDIRTFVCFIYHTSQQTTIDMALSVFLTKDGAILYINASFLWSRKISRREGLEERSVIL